MTVLAGVFGAAGCRAAQLAAGMVSRESGTAQDRPELWCGPDAVMAAARPAWEAAVDGWTGPLITVADDLVVAADASLYYLADLRQKLSRQIDVWPLQSTGSLVAAAVRVWGDRFAAMLEGDFAVVVWDRMRNRVLLTRDLCGRRSLSWTTLDDGSLVVATNTLAVAGFPGVSRQYDREVLAASAACLSAHGDRTAFAHIRPVPSGRTLRWHQGEGVVTADRWVPPAFCDAWTDGPPPDDAADALRALLERAVVERLPREGSASVWMSGGYDSTAVFASARSALEAAGASTPVLPISVSYPEGDPGCEDHFIRDVAARWSAPVRWIPVDSISIVEDVTRRRRLRDDPMPHHFEMMQRVLARASRELGTRIVLDGFGGDQLFFSSADAVLADHLFHGRVEALARLWWKQRDRSLPAFLRRCVLPFASLPLIDWLQTVTGHRFGGALELPPPPWIRSPESLLRVSQSVDPRAPDESVSAFEARFLIGNPYVARVLAWTHRFALDEGIQLRSPLYDSRVIAFAATRPLNERQNGREGKILLRRAMRDLIPASVLAARGRKTGTSADYFRRQLAMAIDTQIRPGLRRRVGGLRLGDLGLVDPKALEHSIEAYLAEPDHLIGAQLFTTFETEEWLALQDGGP